MTKNFTVKKLEEGFIREATNQTVKVVDITVLRHCPVACRHCGNKFESAAICCGLTHCPACGCPEKVLNK